MVIQADSRKPCPSLESFRLDRQRGRVPAEMGCYSDLSPMTTTSHPDLVTLERDTERPPEVLGCYRFETEILV